MAFPLASVPECNGGLGHLTLHGEEVAPFHVLAEHLAHFLVKGFQGILIAFVLPLGCINPTAHIAVPKVALTVHALLAEHSQHLIKRA